MSGLKTQKKWDAAAGLSDIMGGFGPVRPSLFGWYLTIGVIGSLVVGYGWQGWIS